MLVVDANVVVEVTLERFGAKALDMLGDEQLVAPWLLWSEVSAELKPPTEDASTAPETPAPGDGAIDSA